MAHSRNLMLAPFAWIFLFLILACGCRGGGGRITAENHLSELEFEKLRALGALRESVTLERSASSNMRIQEDERTSLAEDLTRKETGLRYLSEQVRKIAAEKSDLEKALAESREAEKKIRESHEKLKDLAFTANQELSELRQRTGISAQEKAKYEEASKAAQMQLEAAVKELDDVKGELTRTKAVVRSLQEHTPIQGSTGAETALRLRIADLEKALSEAMAARDAALTGRTIETGSASGALAAKPPATRKVDLKVLWADIQNLFAERIEDWRQGNFQWDAFELTVAGVLACALLMSFWLLIAMLRGRKLRRQIADLKAYGEAEDDLDKAVDGVLESEPVANPAPVISPAKSFRTAGGTAGKPVEEPPLKASSRRSTYVPAREDRDFSAIISTPKSRKDRAEGGPAQRSEGMPSEDERPRAVKAAPEREEKSSGQKGRMNVGLQGVEPQAPAKPAVSEPRPPSRQKAEAPAPRNRPHEVEGADPDLDMAQTQIISPFDPIEEPGSTPRDSKPKGGEDEKELLDELKEIINKKFDEIMKK